MTKSYNPNSMRTHDKWLMGVLVVLIGLELWLLWTLGPVIFAPK